MMKTTTTKLSAVMLAGALQAYGIRRVVLSPGSRNIPLVLALHSLGVFQIQVVIDERTAAFVALGMALQLREPVACVCTSGSAVLNYAPAIAEAYYRRVPLIAVSADRPADWIDHDDSQTLRQPGCLANIVCGSFDLPDTTSGGDLRRYRQHLDRTLNDALSAALTQRRPVHINVQFDEPLGQLTAKPQQRSFHLIDAMTTHATPYIDMVPRHGLEAYSRVLVVAGGWGSANTGELRRLLQRLQSGRSIPVVSEVQSNVGGMNATVLFQTGEDTCEALCRLKPQLVISLGGSIVSAGLKQYLRNAGDYDHWYVGLGDRAVDCYRHLTARFDCSPETFLSTLLSSEAIAPSQDYYGEWCRLYERQSMLSRRRLEAVGWGAEQAVDTVIRYFATHAVGPLSLHLSNGTTIRYAQRAEVEAGSEPQLTVECNRGVSGIDGSTSTAVGAALAGAEVLLVSGDMSAQYDLGALAIREIPPGFKMAVIDNGGGGIFRHIKSTAGLAPDLVERYLSGNVNLPLSRLAPAYGFDYFEADSRHSLSAQLPRFASAPRRAILHIKV